MYEKLFSKWFGEEVDKNDWYVLYKGKSNNKKSGNKECIFKIETSDFKNLKNNLWEEYGDEFLKNKYIDDLDKCSIVLIEKKDNGALGAVHLFSFDKIGGEIKNKRKKALTRVDSNKLPPIIENLAKRMTPYEVVEGKKVMDHFIDIIVNGEKSLGYPGVVDFVYDINKNSKLNTGVSDRFIYGLKLINRFIVIHLITEAGIIRKYNASGGGKYVKIKINSGDITLKEIFEKTINNSEFNKIIEHLNDEKNEITLNSLAYIIYLPYIDSDLFNISGEEQKFMNTFYKLLEKEDHVLREKTLKLVEFLSSFDWSIHEDEGEEASFLITPEVLSALYEKVAIAFSSLGDEKYGYADLLDKDKEEVNKIINNIFNDKNNPIRKDNGIYYTPRAITEYISYNTVVPRLLTLIGEKGADISNYFDEHEHLKLLDIGEFIEKLKKENSKFKKLLLEACKEITVLDPAVGSGAFPMAAAEVLYKIRKEIESDFNSILISKEIVQKNLYGVDILEGAISVCKMRMWVWILAKAGEEFKEQSIPKQLFVKKTEHIDLPKIEYNFRCGNSLIGIIELNQGLAEYRTNKPNLKGKKVKIKEKNARLFDNLDQALIDYHIEIRQYLETREKDDKNEKELKEKHIKYQNKLNDIFLGELKEKGLKIDKKELEDLNPLHWSLEFYNIMKQGGFDVVIGNPPYFSIDPKLKRISEYEKEIYKNIFQSFMGQTDILVFFYERFFKILKEEGNLSYISKNRWVQSKMYTKFREFLSGKNILVIDFEDRFIFQNVGINTNIIKLIKNDTNNILYFVLKNKNIDKILNLKNYKLYQNSSIPGCSNWDLFKDNITEIVAKKGKYSLTGGCGHKITPKEVFILKKDKKGFIPENKYICNKFNDILIPNQYEQNFISEFTSSGYIFPYSINGNKYIIYTKDLDLKKAKNLKEYFSRVINNRCDTGWYEYHEGKGYRNVNLINQDKKIIAPGRMYLNRGPSFVIVNRKFQIGMDCQVIVNKDKYLNLEYILAILNSKVMWYYYGKKFKKYSSRQTIDVDKIPIPKIPKSEQKPFIEKVDKILAITNKPDYDPKVGNPKVKLLIDEIDQMVYKLYDLDDKEIKVVKDFYKENIEKKKKKK
ncbi:Eco57I restriction-modification methylase domain-containing protein [Candidatus Micrarchaeota archaeon]|jgi:hypothetical protein|nr:Eco57I restriction-modification methylase domain-containing protein [Candidatus Micrarchaeota archaeon]